MKTCKKSLHQFEGKRCIECKKSWHKEHRKELNTWHTNWRNSNPKKNQKRLDNSYEKRKSITKQWKKTNSQKVNALNAKRRALKLGATPSWLSIAQLKEIESFYTKAKALSIYDDIIYHVDHIIPLQGNNICGLHVPWNLQVITAEQNYKKNNKY